MTRNSLKSLRPEHYFSELLRLTHASCNSFYLNAGLILLYFLQLAGLILKIHLDTFSDPKLIFFVRTALYSSPSNFLLYFENLRVSYFFLIVALGIVSFLWLYPFFLIVIRKGLIGNIDDYRIVGFLNVLFEKFMCYFNWGLMMPCLELGVNILVCGKYGYLFTENCNQSTLWLATVYLCCGCFGIGLSQMWVFKDDSFMNVQNLRKPMTFFAFLAFLLRFSVIAFFPLLYASYPSLVYIIILGFSASLFACYCSEFPIRHEALNKLYISTLCSFIVFILLLMLWNYTTLIKENEILYIQAATFPISFKLGQKLQENRYQKALQSNFKDPSTKVFLLEEILWLFKNMDVYPNKLLIKGIFLSHTRHCLMPECKLRPKHTAAFEELNDLGRMKIIGEFICYVLSNSIEEAQKNSDFIKMEFMILKYAGFLSNHSLNSPIKAFFEVQSLLFRFPKLSYYFQCLKPVLVNQLKKKIREKFKEQHLSAIAASFYEEKELDVSEYLELLREKNRLSAAAAAILKEKITFFETYKEGVENYQNALLLIRKTTRKIKDFQSHFLESKQSHHKVLLSKLQSFLYAVLLNNPEAGLLAEDELEAIKRREYCSNHGLLSIGSLFDLKMLDIQVSLLSSRGDILPSSRTAKLANLFGYSKEEIRQVKLGDLMPDIIAEHHKLFVDWYLNKPMKKGQLPFRFNETYAKHREGLIFGIRTFIGHALEIRDDFVMHAIVRPLSKSEEREKSLIFDEDGAIQGISAEFFSIWKTTFNNLQPKEFNLLNIYSLIPVIKDILEKNKVLEARNEVVIRNQLGSILVPRNLMEILDILKLKKKHEGKVDKENSYFSGRTSRSKTHSDKSHKSVASQKSFKQKSQFMTKLLTSKGNNVSIDRKSLLEQKFKDNLLSNKDVVDELINTDQCDRLRIAFDLRAHFYAYGEKPKQKLALLYLNITRARNIPQGVGTGDISNNKMTTNFALERNTMQESLRNSKEIENDKFIDVPAENSKISDVPTSFVQMPPENVPDFGQMSNTDRGLSDLNMNLLPGLGTFEETKRSSSMLQTPNKNYPFNNLQVRNPSDVNSSRKSHDAVDSPHRNLETIKNMTTNQNLLTRNTHSHDLIPEPLNDHNNADLDQALNGSFHSSKSQNIKQTPISSFKADIGIQIPKRPESVASSRSGLNKSYAIFQSIRNLQKRRPRQVLGFSLSGVIELILVLIYCIIVSELTVKYVSEFYKPLRTDLDNISGLTTTLYTVTLASVQLELAKLNYTNLVPGSLGSEIISKIIDRSFKDIQSSYNIETNQETIFKYQEIYKSERINVIDPTFNNSEEISFMDFIEGIVQTLGNMRGENLEEETEQKLSFLTTNFLGLSKVCSEMIAEIKNEFAKTNDNTSRNLLIVMVIFVLFAGVLKLLQYRLMLDIYALFTRIISIFLRVNENSAYNEIFFLREIRSLCFNEESTSAGTDLLNTHFPEKLLTKKTLEVISSQTKINVSSNSPIKKKKRQKGHDSKSSSKKNSFHHNLKPLTLIKQRLVVSAALLFLCGYLIFIYFYWTMVDQQISNLISINNFFNLMYTLPSLVQVLAMQLMRERLLFGDNATDRLLYFNSELALHMEEIGSTGISFPKYLFSAQNQIHDSAFDILISGNLCQKLQNEDGGNYIKECSKLLDQAFTRGMIETNNQLINNMKILQEMVKLNSTVYSVEQQRAQMLEFLNQNKGVDLVASEYFYEGVNQEFFRILTSYYNTLVEEQVSNMELVIILTTLVASLSAIGSMVTGHWGFKRIYEEVTLVLSLIPYEKLIGDEQTAFLIKRLLN